jgi:hypothetical protein
MTLANVPARTLVPLEQIVHRYLEKHPGEGGTLYLPHSDWQRVKALADGEFAEAEEEQQLAAFVGVLVGATSGVIGDVLLIPDVLGPARILPSFGR